MEFTCRAVLVQLEELDHMRVQWASFKHRATMDVPRRDAERDAGPPRLWMT